MKKLYLFVVLVSITLFASCTKDPGSTTPVVEEEKIPADFNWKTISEVNLSVSVASIQGVSDNMLHVIKVYTSPLAIDEYLVATGSAKPGSPFVIKLTLPAGIEKLYVKDYKPNGLMTTTEVAVSSSSINVNITKSNSESVVMTRVANSPSPSITVPTNYDEVINNNNGSVTINGFPSGTSSSYGNTYKSFLIPQGFTRTATVDFSGWNQHAVLYVAGKLTLNSSITMYKSSLVVLNGGEVTIKGASISNPQAGFPSIYVQSGGKITFNGEVSASGGAILVNKGTFTVNGNVDINTASKVYNESNLVVSGKNKTFHVTNNCYLYNSGNIGCVTFNMTTNASFMMDVNSTFQSSYYYQTNNATLNNHGTLNAILEFKSNGGGIVNNNCSITSEKIILQGSVTNLGSGSLMNCVKLNLNNNTVNFSGGSMLIFTDITDIYAFKALSDASEYSVMKCLGTMPDFRYASSQFKGKIELVHANLVSGNGANGRDLYEGLFNNNGSILSKEQTKNIVGTTCNGGEGEIVPPAPPVIDNDGDGVAVENDYDDSDANVAFASYFPTENTRGTYAFEDLWPWKGDYDMNDLVMTFRIKYLSNASNKVTSIIFDYNVIAAGSMQDLSAAFQLDKVNASDVKSVTGQTLGSTIPFDINSNGTEKGATTAIIPLFNKVSDLVTYTSFLNTVNGQFEQTPNKTLVIKFNTGIDQSNLTIANFNMFIVANTKGSTSRGKEIHLPTYKATSKADPAFATGKQLSANDKYKFEDGMMWGLMFPSVFQYPQESKALFDAYLHFKAWAFSGGNEYKDWYTDKSGYINQSLIYER